VDLTVVSAPSSHRYMKPHSAATLQIESTTRLQSSSTGMADQLPSPSLKAPLSTGEPLPVQTPNHYTQLLQSIFTAPPRMNRDLCSDIDNSNDALLVDFENISSFLGYTERRERRSSPATLPKPFDKAQQLPRVTVQTAPLVWRSRISSSSSRKPHYSPKHHPYSGVSSSCHVSRALYANRHNPTHSTTNRAPITSQPGVSPQYHFDAPIESNTSSFLGWPSQERDWPSGHTGLKEYEEAALTPEDGSLRISQTVEPSQTLLTAPTCVNPKATLGDDSHHGVNHAQFGQTPSLPSQSRTSVDEVCQLPLDYQPIRLSYEDDTELHVNRATSITLDHDLIPTSSIQSRHDQAQLIPYLNTPFFGDLPTSCVDQPLSATREPAEDGTIINSNSNVYDNYGDLGQRAHESLSSNTAPPTTEMEAERLHNHFKKQESGYKCVYLNEEGPCNTFFPRKSRLLDHVRTHTGDRPFICQKEWCAYP
jgi:hypothetical protein